MYTTYYRCAGLFEDGYICCFDTKGEQFLVSDVDFEHVFGKSWSVNTVGYVHSSRYTGTPNKPKNARIHNDILKSRVVDHINGDRADNRRTNIRAATTQQNSFNVKKTANRKCKYKGVTEYWSKKRVLTFRARIRFNNELIQLGHKFATQEEAACAYDKAAREYFGEFAWLNFP